MKAIFCFLALVFVSSNIFAAAAPVPDTEASHSNLWVSVLECDQKALGWRFFILARRDDKLLPGTREVRRYLANAPLVGPVVQDGYQLTISEGTWAVKSTTANSKFRFSIKLEQSRSLPQWPLPQQVTLSHSDGGIGNWFCQSPYSTPK